MARRSDHSREQIKEMALQATEKILIEQGLTGLSTRKVAAAIGYTAGSLYLVFENLEDLLLHVNVRTLEKLFQTLQGSANDCPEVQTCLRNMALAYITFAKDHPNLWSAIFERQWQNEMPDWYNDKIAHLFQLVEGKFQQLLPEARTDKIAQAVRAYWCGVHGVCMLGLTGKLDAISDHSTEELSNTLIDNFLFGLTSKKGPRDD
ncbi:MAG: TetR-like C-terminal domain-containing protein [Gammaproteobacteria bacterium]|nr:MAG: TetR-like C-terminal domain-containing protein [Gammaproteobacteria bacterium]